MAQSWLGTVKTTLLYILALYIGLFVIVNVISERRKREAQRPYFPLPSRTHTRLVVFPSRWGEQERLCATLEVVDLADNPVDEAVSYVWGQEVFTNKNIFIDGKKVSIRYNLWAFLQRLGRDGRPRKLWIDALSIRQDETREKSQQVSLIGSIFHQATHVHVWAGEHEYDSQMLFQPRPLPERESISFQHRLSNNRRVLHNDPRNEQLEQAWRSFINREYFKRRWIVQELLLAKNITVHCGESWTSWEQFVESRYGTREPDQPRDINYLDGIVFHYLINRPFFELLELRRQRVTRLPLLELMKTFEKTKCSNPLDKVYAFLAIDSRQDDEPVIEPSYTLTIEELFVKVLHERLGEFASRQDRLDRIASISEMFDLTSRQLGTVDKLLGHGSLPYSVEMSRERRARLRRWFRSAVGDHR